MKIYYGVRATVTDLGVIIDSQVSMANYVAALSWA